MHTASTNICARMGHSRKVSEFQHGSMIGCHECSKSSHQISSVLNISQSAVWEAIGSNCQASHHGEGLFVKSCAHPLGSP